MFCDDLFHYLQNRIIRKTEPLQVNDELELYNPKLVINYRLYVLRNILPVMLQASQAQNSPLQTWCIEPSHALTTNGPIRVEDETRHLTLRSGRWRGVGHKHIRKAEEANSKPHMYVEWNLLGFMKLLLLLRFGTFPFWGESGLWSDVWPAIDTLDGVVCLSLLLEGETTISNNFTKRRQNGFKIGTRDKYASHLR